MRSTNVKENKVLKTKIHYYRFDIGNLEEKQKYKILCNELKSKGYTLFDSISLMDHDKKTEWFNKIKNLENKGIIELETEFLFNNQWNTNKNSLNLRVFDWAEEIYANKDIKEGYYMDITPEMKEIRQNTFKCGYCGKQYYKPGKNKTFCLDCLDYEYLKEDNLKLLRLYSVANDNNEYPELSEKELNYLIPKFNLLKNRN
jgi:hypothetical protein